MTTRTDLRIIYSADPRLIIVDAPSTEITIQDLHDTLSVIDQQFTSMSYPHTLSTSGKENLGGGISVGLTCTLQNAQLAFERRTVRLLGGTASGTITTAGEIGAFFQTVIDSGGTFIVDGIARGDIVSNLTDGSYAEVLSVDSETQLTVLSPTGGIDDDYDIGDVYEVWLNEASAIVGGNLVAVEADGLTILQQTFPTFGVGLVRTASVSATLVEQADIQFSSFEGAVHIDVLNGTSGTDFPIGTPRQPVNNLTDGAAINIERGLKRFFVFGDLAIGTESNWTGYVFEGENPNRSTITVSGSATTDGVEILRATVSGTLAGTDIQISESIADDLTISNGLLDKVRLRGSLILTGPSSTDLLDCYSGVPGGGPTDTPTIDLGGSGQAMLIRGYSGGIKLSNKTGADKVSIDLNSGQIFIKDTVTTGDVTLRGIGKWTNEDTYTGGAPIRNELLSTGTIVATFDANTHDGETLTDILQDLLAMASGRIEERPTGTFTFYERDNTTIRFVLTKAGDERNRS